MHPQLPPLQVPSSGFVHAPPTLSQSPLAGLHCLHCPQFLFAHRSSILQLFEPASHDWFVGHFVMHLPPHNSCASVHPQFPPLHVPLSGFVHDPPALSQSPFAGLHALHGPQVLFAHRSSILQLFEPESHDWFIGHFVMHLPPHNSCASVHPQLPPLHVPLSGFVHEPSALSQFPFAGLHALHCAQVLFAHRSSALQLFELESHDWFIGHFVMHLPPHNSCASVHPQLPPLHVPLSGFVHAPSALSQLPFAGLHALH